MTKDAEAEKLLEILTIRQATISDQLHALTRELTIINTAATKLRLQFTAYVVRAELASHGLTYE